MNRLKIALVGLSLLAGAPEVFRRVVMLFEPSMQIVALAAFGLLLALCTVSLIGAASFRHGFLRWPLAALLAAGSATVDGYQWVVGSFMDYDAFVTMIQSSVDAAWHGDCVGNWQVTCAFARNWPETCRNGQHYAETC